MKIILIVDDQEMVAEITKAGLGSEYDIFIAHIGQVAIEIIERESPNLIILDYHLGESAVSSFDVAAIAKQFNIPVLILSGLADFEDAVKFNRLGVKEFMTKPYSLVDLRSRVERMLGNG